MGKCTSPTSATTNRVVMSNFSKNMEYSGFLVFKRQFRFLFFSKKKFTFLSSFIDEIVSIPEHFFR